MNTLARLLLVVGAVAIAGVSAADPTVTPVADQAGKRILVDDTVTAAQLRKILRMGYKPEKQARGNEVYYCRSERELGTRFQTKACKTAAQIFQEELGGKEVTSNMEHIGATSEGARK